MHHAVQSASRIISGTTKGYTEGAATIYGKTIDNAGTLKVRSETEVFAQSLMHPDAAFRYGNEDFFTTLRGNSTAAVSTISRACMRR